MSVMICMFLSATYHLYNPLGKEYKELLLMIDVLGIGVMIFGLAMACTFVCFHNWELERNLIEGTLAVLFLMNVGMQIMPCCADRMTLWHKTLFYCVTVVSCTGLAVSARFYFATELEVNTLY